MAQLHAKSSRTEHCLMKKEPVNSCHSPTNLSTVYFAAMVLEHVRDLPKVIAEISRVLKPGGVFIYDTLGRTFISKLSSD